MEEGGGEKVGICKGGSRSGGDYHEYYDTCAMEVDK